ncbi:hypothetical protein [Azospirillum soli]|uniref:flagellin N-terminal helical domain-containing protein n=1 Tax=Azospirillum soli TaxID=1304799 RepID=UPI001AE22701|nr:hypothetical protein [Azospirillum soli]MBP2312142.1 flagellin-like hook-associated protein FlgL [Azospirillum soli]
MVTSDVQLPAAMRSNLLTLQVTQQQQASVNQRLATGQKINTALDSPPVYFAAKALTQRASDLSAMKEAIGQAISTVKAGDTGAKHIGDLLAQARGLTTAALSSLGTDAASIRARKSLAGQFDAVLDQINGVARDGGYGGKNLLVGDGSKMEATTESKLDVQRIAGVRQARVTDISAPDSYDIRVEGSGAILGSAEGIADAEQQLGLTGLTIGGVMSSTKGNINNIEIAVTGSPGQDKVITVTNPPETASLKFTVDDWKAADAAGKTLSFNHAFESGSRVSFNVDFDQIDATPRNVGTRSVEIEKHAALAVKVTNGQGLTVTRDLMSPLGQGKLANGANDFVFPTGTVRVEVDEKAIVGTGDNYDEGYIPADEAAAFDSNGMPLFNEAGVPPGDAAKNLKVPQSTGFLFSVGLPDSSAPGFRNFYVKDGWDETVTAVSIPNAAVKDYPITLAGSNVNSGSTIYVNVNSYNPLHNYSALTPGPLHPIETLNQSYATIATNSPQLEYDSPWPPFLNYLSLASNSITGFVPGVNTKLTAKWGGLDSAGPGSTTFSLTDDAGRTFDTVLPNTMVGTTLDVSFPPKDQYPESSMRLLLLHNMPSGPSGGSYDLKIIWPEGRRPTATLKTDLVTPANRSNDLFVAFDTAHRNGVTVESQNLQVEGKGLHVDYSQNGWMDRQDIENAAKGLDTAEQRLRSASQVLTNGMGIITTRENFMKGFSDVLDEGANKLTLADQNEEGATLLTLQTRQQLSQTALSLANQNQQSILSLFR